MLECVHLGKWLLLIFEEAGSTRNVALTSVAKIMIGWLFSNLRDLIRLNIPLS